MKDLTAIETLLLGTYWPVFIKKKKKEEKKKLFNSVEGGDTKLVTFIK